MEARVSKAACSLKALRAELRAMQKQALRQRLRSSGVLSPTVLLALRAVLMFLLCGDLRWPMLWSMWFQQRQRSLYPMSRQLITEQVIQGWVTMYQNHPMLVPARAQLDHPWRIAADTFLIESLVYEDVLNSNARGFVVPCSALVSWYARKWQRRPRSSATDSHLLRMEQTQSTARNWACRFRHRWKLLWGELSKTRTLSRDEIRVRAAIYVRWVQWSVAEQNRSGPVVIIGMDETAVASVHRTMRGTAVSAQKQSSLPHATPHVERHVGRTALMACVCSDADLQPHLPQIWLPRSDASKAPPASIRAVFTASGSPHEAWYGTRGFATQQVMRAWLTRVRRKVRLLRPSARLVVVMDVCPVHVGESVLRHARRLGIEIVFVPARLTWLLQFLDTHVFAQLKREMRRQLWDAAHAARVGVLSPAEQLAALTRATSAKLVHGNWTHLIGRVCLNGDIGSMRPSLRELLQDIDLTPRAPTNDELAMVLGAHRTHVEGVARTLFPSRAPSAEAAQDGSVSACVVTEADGLEESSFLQPILHTTFPVTTGSGASSSSQAPANVPESDPVVRVPRGRRLWPCPRNLMIVPEPRPPETSRINTRSQKRPLMEGVVGAAKRSKSGLD